jgi:hypothetical protein
MQAILGTLTGVAWQWKKDGVNVVGGSQIDTGPDGSNRFTSVYTTPATVHTDDGSAFSVAGTGTFVAGGPAGVTTDGLAILTVNPCDDMNCDCEDASPYRTLATLRTSMMRRLGYSAMAANPPPGMSELLTEFLQDAQKQIMQKRPDLRTKRIFKWNMVAGTRFYAFSDQASCCDMVFDQTKVDWVGVEDLNGRWYELINGIPPEFYTTRTQRGLPVRYDMRSCIEVYPAPAGAYTLRIKGDFGLNAFAADGDKTTIDDHVVFLLALANAKVHYKQQDAKSVYQQYTDYLAGMVSDKHATARYIPGVKKIPPAVQPVMTAYDVT